MEAWLGFALSALVKVTLVLVAALVATACMRRRSAAERHLVWVAAVFAVLAVPVVALLAPAVRLPVEVPSWVARGGETPTPAAGGVVQISAPAPAVPRVAVQTEALPVVSSEPAVAEPGSANVPFLLLAVWLSVSIVLALRLLAEFAAVHVLARRAQPVRDAALQIRTRGMAATMGIQRRVRLLQADASVMPMTFGIMRPTLLLPSCASTWTAARQDVVLRHELAHVRRHDALTQLAAEVGCALYWFHPLMWCAARELRVEREHACDDAVIVAGSRASDYAAELLGIARATRPARVTALAAIAIARPSKLRARLDALLDERPRHERASARLLVPTSVGALLVLLPITATPGGRSAVLPQSPLSAAGDVVAEAPHQVADAPASLTTVAAPPLSEHQPPRIESSAGVVVSVWSGELPAAGQDDCLSGNSTNITHNSNDDRRTLKWSGRNCSGELVLEGAVEFDPDFTRIVGVSRNGYVRLTSESGRTERRFVMQAGANGVTYEYSVNGERRPYDADAQRWVSEQLLFMFRRMGFMARERATAILERRGAEALLQEVDRLTGDYARAAYLEVLIAHGRLDEASLRRVLTQAGNTIRSDYYRTQIITAVAGRYTMTPGVRDAYIEAASGIDSDHYRHQAFSTLLSKGQLTSAQVSAVLRESNRIDSDHYRAALLREVESLYRSNPDIRAAFLEAATAMDSDHYVATVLERLLTRGGLSGAELARVVDAAATMESDHYRATVLKRVAETGLDDVTLRRAFVRAAAGIDSDHYLLTVLTPAVQRDRLEPDVLMSLLEAAASIESDHYQSQLLVEIANRHRLTGETRARFTRIMDSIDSEHYRNRVASALLRQTG